ncbi:MAG: hypothetical protein KDB00_02550, partial [Planctomycetales bacterium]|nr:hypothetical protein [Planctomycetales bacterium]
MTNVKLGDGLVLGDWISAILNSAMDASEGLLRLKPTCAPRSFLYPGDYCQFGANRGGIDERWFGSTTDAANEGQVWHEGRFVTRLSLSSKAKRFSFG